ncbi:MAG: phosphatase PAP2 family protein [Polaromonas sp.]
MSIAQRLLSRLDGEQPLLKPLLIGLAALLLLLAFVFGGGEIMEGDTRPFDAYLLHVAQSLRSGHPWLAGTMRDFSGLGSTVVLTLFTVATVVYLALFSSRIMAFLVAASVVSGAVLVSVFKTAFGRLRPDAVFAELVTPGLSFPSGHASMSALVFLTIGALIAASRSRVNERIYILATAALLALLVGVSRVLLGVHWATDVLGGWAFGTAWAMLWLVLARHFVKNRQGR